jgi:hypothetical protein
VISVDGDIGERELRQRRQRMLPADVMFFVVWLFPEPLASDAIACSVPTPFSLRRTYNLL